jgi:ribosomal protein L37AE/L43A
MPKVSGKEIPEKLRPFHFLGLDMRWEGKQVAEADCPFCGKENHFFIKLSTGQWQCKICGGPSDKGGGNIYSFIRELHKISMEQTPEDDLELVSEERRIPAYILREWGLCLSVLDHDWMYPGYGIPFDESGKRNVNNIYRWVKAGKKRKGLTTTGLEHCLGGIHLFDDSKPDIFLQEGYWDGMSVEHALSRYKLSSGLLTLTSKPYETLLASANVLAVPGSETFKESWIPIFKGKRVFIGFDNDYPRRFPDGHAQAGEYRLIRGRKVIPGYNGMEKVVKMLNGVATSIKILGWGEEGYDPALADGFDARDYLTTDTYAA